MLAGFKDAGVFAEDFLEGVTGGALKGGVCPSDFGGEVGDEDNGLGLLDGSLEGAELEFAVADGSNVGGNGEEADVAVMAVEEGNDFQLDPIRSAVFMVVKNFQGEGLKEVELLAHFLDSCGVGFGTLEDGGTFSHDFVKGIACEGCEGIVNPNDFAVGIGEEDGIASVFSDDG